MTLRSGELFAGVGGLSLAIDEVFDTEPAWFAEIDDAPARVLAYHFPQVPNLGDVTAIDWLTVPRVHVLGGGFPCQDVSQAGARRGLRDGTRSGLWSEFARAIDALRPSWVVIENVRGLLSADGEEPHDAYLVAVDRVERLEYLDRRVQWHMQKEGSGHDWRRLAVRVSRSLKRAIRARDRERRLVRRAIDTVLRDLAELGFDAEWEGLRAADIGAPHGRFRVFILAWPQERTPAYPGDGSRIEERACPESVVGGGDPVLTLLPTPTVVMNDGETAETWLARRDRQAARGINGNGMGMPLPIAVQLLPTPVTTDSRDAARHATTTDVAHSGTTLTDAIRLLPTPQVADANGTHATRSGDRSDELLPPGVAVKSAGTWGKYAPAVERWEALTRPAPEPARLDGTRGQPRLNPELPEWMMGYTAGWVTAPEIGLSRKQQLTCVGNGVVTQQAIAGIRRLLARPGVPALERSAA